MLCDARAATSAADVLLTVVDHAFPNSRPQPPATPHTTLQDAR
ncbi:hypothetical protein [Streptomyces sp. NPDC001635]